MKILFPSVFLILLATACGNPHISSSKGGLEQSNAPVTAENQEPCVPSAQQIRDYNFYFGGHLETQAPAEFSELIKCKTRIAETFNSFPDGTTTLITNMDRVDFSYQLIHQTERPGQNRKVTFLDDIFGTEKFSMEIQNPISHEGIQGKDRGVNSLNADNRTKDALVWSYSTPISFWSVNVVSLETSPMEPAKLRLYGCDRELMKEVDVRFPNNEHGEKELHFIGVISAERNICHVSLTAADVSGSVVIDEFSYGR